MDYNILLDDFISVGLTLGMEYYGSLNPIWKIYLKKYCSGIFSVPYDL